jgi:endonuclease VIII
MEGPSLFLAAQQLAPFINKKILSVSGNTKIGKERLKGKKVIDLFSWGKLLIMQFDDFALRTHFMLFGTFEATVNKVDVTGDYKRARDTRLTLKFSNGEIRMFNCSVKYIEDANYRSQLDFTQDTMSSEWDAKKALKRSLAFPDEEIGDLLLDQDIFAGVGNIIKNEVLFLAKVQPKKKVKKISRRKLQEIIATTEAFCRQFYEWRKIFMLKKNLKIYRKGICPVCGGKVKREKTGRRARWSFYCPRDQKA